ncbi:MAG: toll/interleukin-1 receptor domain-containing protein [Pirellulales bacterium]
MQVGLEIDKRFSSVECVVLYDIPAFAAYIAVYIAQTGMDCAFYKDLLKQLLYGRSIFPSSGKIRLPEIKRLNGDLRLYQQPELQVQYKFWGSNVWQNAMEIQATRRVFIYSESDLPTEDIEHLCSYAKSLGHKLEFRDHKYIERCEMHEHPLAFISHDSRDKEDVARPIANHLERMLCPVWFDESSLKIGDNLRTSIEKGIKECKKCILVLSPNFFSNTGWTKKEFDSIFTRELLEGKNLVLPIWHSVTKHDVFDYCPSLANVFGLDWIKLGENEVCRQLYNAIKQ